MDEQMIECLDAHEAALSGLVDKLFAAGAREAGLLVSQASATVGSLAQEIRAAHSVMSARLAELEEVLKASRRVLSNLADENAISNKAPIFARIRVVLCPGGPLLCGKHNTPFISPGLCPFCDEEARAALDPHPKAHE